MSLKYLNNERIVNTDNRLSLSRNFNRTETKLETKTVPANQQQLKSILVVYISEDNRKYIDKAAAYALGLTDVRAVMTGDLNLFEINDRQFDLIKNKNYEIEYRQLLSKDAPKREAIKVFTDGLDHYIEISAAYALGLIDAKNFNMMESQFYKISENMLVFLNNKYDVETHVVETIETSKSK